MNSIKNLVVVVMLLAVSYGAFQVINSPDPTAPETVNDLDLAPGARILDDTQANAPPVMPSESPEIKMPAPPPMLSQSSAGEGEFAMPNVELPKQPSAPPSVPDSKMLADDSASFVQSNAPDLDEGSVEFAGGVESSSELGGGSFDATPMTNLQQITPHTDMEQATPFVPDQPPSTTPSALAEPTTPVQNDVDWSSIEQMVRQGQLADALKRLSSKYRADSMADQTQLLQWLDPLAGKVIYSTEHHLFPRPHVVQQGETLESLSATWQVPLELIYNVNRQKISGQTVLTPGTELKKIEGPFSAQISLGKREMTLFLGDLYAGRFPVQVGNSSTISPGQFSVLAKSNTGQSYTDAFGKVIPAGDSNNPFGKYWIDLGNRISIHDVNDAANPGEQWGYVRLSQRDAADVYGILSDGSGITIVR